MGGGTAYISVFECLHYSFSPTLTLLLLLTLPTRCMLLVLVLQVQLRYWQQEENHGSEAGEDFVLFHPLSRTISQAKKFLADSDTILAQLCASGHAGMQPTVIAANLCLNMFIVLDKICVLLDVLPSCDATLHYAK